MTKKLNETMRVTATHLSELGQKIVDPRTDESCKVYYERKGRFMVGETVYNGSYIVYNSPSMSKSYAGVFVAEELNEDDTDMQTVTLVALDPARRNVVSRTRYRARMTEKKIARLFNQGK